MNDDSLDKLISTMAREQESVYPTHWPAPDTLWRSLIKRRNHAKHKKFIWRIAACLLIIMMAGYTFFLQNRQDETLNKDFHEAAWSVKEQNAIDFIARYCKEKSSSCNTSVIQELRTDLEQSFRKLEEINNQLQVYGNDAELVRAKTRIENHQACLLKTIVQTL